MDRGIDDVLCDCRAGDVQYCMYHITMMLVDALYNRGAGEVQYCMTMALSDLGACNVPYCMTLVMYRLTCDVLFDRSDVLYVSGDVLCDFVAGVRGPDDAAATRLWRNEDFSQENLRQS
jgi:hypothetical protein